MIVLDASIAVKLFRPESGSDAALKLYLEHAGSLIAPDLFAIEVSAALVRIANTEKLLRDPMEQALGAFRVSLLDEAISLVPTDGGLLAEACRHALALGHPLKDCVYLALAIERECPLITADAKFARKARNTWSQVRTL